MITDLGAPLSPKKCGTRTALSSSFASPPQSPVRNNRNINGSSSSLYINTTSSPCSPTKTLPRTADRFIPNRADMDFDFCNHQLNQASKVDENGASLSPTNSTNATRSLQMMLSSVLGGATHRDTNANKHILDNDNCTNNTSSSSSSLIHYNSPKRKVARLVGCFHNNGESKRPLRMIGEEALLLRPANWNNGSALSALTGGGSSGSSHSPLSHSSSHHHRAIVSTSTRVLDAPDLMDDYYLNLLSWGKSNNVIAVALHQSVYLWHASDSRIEELLTLEGDTDYISSVQWSAGEHPLLAVGTHDEVVQIWDADTMTQVRELEGHGARISSLAWNNGASAGGGGGGASLLSSGGRDSVILNHDLRVRRHVVSCYTAHQQEVCGLAWSPDGATLASGGNENALCLWDNAMSSSSSTPTNSGNSPPSYSPRVTLHDHVAAVKAIAWCPWQRHTLATGGGTADRTIRIWNAALGNNIKSVDTVIKSVDTGSQVCAIQWSDCHKELVSSHGFSDNQLILWKYSNMSKLREFRGHTSRVLHLAKSPDGDMIVSASADETLRFWNIFGSSTSSISGSATKAKNPSSSSSLSPTRGGPGVNTHATLSGGVSMSLR